MQEHQQQTMPKVQVEQQQMMQGQEKQYEMPDKMQCCLFVFGLRPFRDEDLQHYFSKYGNVSWVKRVPTSKNDFGFIYFDSPIAAERAFYDGVAHVDADGKSSRQHFINDGSVFVRRRTVGKHVETVGKPGEENVSEYIGKLYPALRMDIA